MLEPLVELMQHYGFWGFVLRGVLLGIPIAVAFPILHTRLFERFLCGVLRCLIAVLPKEKTPH